MIRFIVVDDNSLHLRKTHDLIMKNMMKNQLDFSVDTYENVTDDLLDMIKNDDEHHVYVLDFELPNTSAIDLAKIIRKTDWKSPIIINTIYSSFTLHSFKQRLQLLDFINKNDDYEKNLMELINICLEQCDLSKSLKFRKSGIDYNIPFKSILYIYRETVSRKIFIITNNHSYDLYSSLKEIRSMLSKDFIFTHKACIVNMKRVETIDWINRIITFDNGETTDLLSSTHKAGVIQYKS